MTDFLAGFICALAFMLLVLAVMWLQFRAVVEDLQLRLEHSRQSTDFWHKQATQHDEGEA